MCVGSQAPGKLRSSDEGPAPRELQSREETCKHIKDNKIKKCPFPVKSEPAETAVLQQRDAMCIYQVLTSTEWTRPGRNLPRLALLDS